jgi:integrase
LEAEAEAKRRTVKLVLKLWYELNEKRWTNAKYRDNVWSAFKRYAFPTIGDIPVDEVQPDDIMRVVEPHWNTKRETMARLRTNIAAAFSMAKAKKWRKGDNPAAWADNLEHMLTKRSRGEEAEHHAAMPYAQVPAFMATLRESSLISARALEFTILTASRTNETAEMRWQEVNIEAGLWTVPPGRIKARRSHTVLLCDRSIQILKEMEGLHKDYVFPNRTNDGPMSDGSMLQLLRRMGHKPGQADVHGFRSSFKDWCREMTNFPEEASEIAQAHQVGNETRRAYARGALLAKRRKMMDAWSNYCCRQEQGNVVELHQGKRKAATK